MTETVGFIGLGKMGEPMAGHILEAGHKLIVCDVRDEAVAALVGHGATTAKSPAAVASQARTIIVSLVKDVALGSNRIVAGGAVKNFIDLSTSGPDMAREIAAGLAVRGIGFVDFPVSGGVAGALAGTLAVMAACSDELFANYSSLDAIGNVFHVGTETGQ